MWQDIVQQVILPVAAIIASGLATWAVAVFQRKTGVEIEARHREAFQTALENAAGLALQRAVGIDPKALNVGSEAVREAAIYVKNAVPDAVQKFGLSDTAIEQRVLAKVGLVTGAATEVKPAG